ncbi:MAG: sporulation initiation factor Spo0A C-terminal domain-containing protein [Oscillospiraceae bacterium]|jgi:hydroxymethylpyrimidine/phosphomethylpyrimidine kinase|nr:sporulation initiation factor Spo0A C-terminal domain-containing protein [Oscillospiraceae bacterium]
MTNANRAENNLTASERRFEEQLLAVKTKMLKMGMLPKYNGFEYLAEAIVMFEPGIKICDQIYGKIAKKHGSTKTSVERCVRTLLKISGFNVKNGDFISMHNFLWLEMG